MPMPKKSPLRYALEFVLSVNLGLAVTLAHSAASSFPLEDRLKWSINSHYQLDLHNQLGAYAAFFILATLLALCIFILLRVLSLMNHVEFSAIVVTGLVSASAAPACWLYLAVLAPVWTNGYGWNIALLTELIFVAAYLSWHIRRSYSIAKWKSILLLCAHCALWSWLFFARFRTSVSLLFPVLGFCSALLVVLRAHSNSIEMQGVTQH